MREPAKRSPVTPLLPSAAAGLSLCPSRSAAPAQRPLTARSPRQRGRRPPAPQGAGERSGRAAAPHGRRRRRRSRPAPVRGRRCRLSRRAGAGKVPPGAGAGANASPYRGTCRQGFIWSNSALMCAPSLPFLGTRKDPQAEARSDDTATRPQLSAPFITKKHTGLAGHSSKYKSLRFGAGSEGSDSSSRHCGLEQNLWAPAWLGLGQAPHGTHPSWPGAAP